MSSLNGSWIEIFRAGDYGERGEWTAQDLDRLAAAYNPRLQPAPVVVGHPKDDAPAYGWVARLRRAGQSLWAQLEKVDAGFEKLLREGRFRQRSVALYRNFAPTGAPYLRHVGFLGAQPPAVKGLAPVRFTEDSLVEFNETIGASSVGQTFLSASPEAQAGPTQNERGEMPAPPTLQSEETVTPNKLEKFFDHLRSFFTGEEGSHTPATLHSDVQPGGPRHRELPPPATSATLHTKDSLEEGLAPAVSSPSLHNPTFEERLNQLEQRLETLDTVQPGGPRHRELPHPAILDAQHSAIETFVETLRRRGSFPPAFDRLGVAEFLQRLAAADAVFAETDLSSVSSGHGFPERSGGPELARLGGLAEGNRAETGAPLGATGEGACPERRRRVRGNPQKAGQPFRGAIQAQSSQRALAPEDNPQKPSMLSWFQEFLSQLPRVIEFNELTPGPGAGRESTSPPARVIRFTEPRRGVEVDLASIELAERAEAFAAEQGVTYAEALTQLRHSQRHTQSTA